MQELEKIMEEIKTEKKKHWDPADESDKIIGWCFDKCIDIIRKHMNNGWISVDEKPKKDYETVFAVDKNDYYFVAVYDKYHGFRSNDIGADVDNIVAYCLFDPYRPERSDGK